MKYPGLVHQFGSQNSGGVLLRSARAFLRSQFGRPSGFCGELVGKFMAHRASNRERIQWTIELLEIKPDDRVLEVGFGPGMSIELVSNLAYRGFVAGIDHSEVMVRQATKRNTQAIRGGRVALHQGSVSKLPVFGTPFDKIFSINSIHFWNDSTQQLRELHRLMRPGGIIAVTLQPRSREATDDMAKQIGEEIITKLQTAGFSRCRLEIRKMKPVSAACAIGTS